MFDRTEWIWLKEVQYDILNSSTFLQQFSCREPLLLHLLKNRLSVNSVERLRCLFNLPLLFLLGQYLILQFEDPSLSFLSENNRLALSRLFFQDSAIVREFVQGVKQLLFHGFNWAIVHEHSVVSLDEFYLPCVVEEVIRLVTFLLDLTLHTHFVLTCSPSIKANLQLEVHRKPQYFPNRADFSIPRLSRKLVDLGECLLLPK